jgi:hypothetical protein
VRPNPRTGSSSRPLLSARLKRPGKQRCKRFEVEQPQDRSARTLVRDERRSRKTGAKSCALPWLIDSFAGSEGTSQSSRWFAPILVKVGNNDEGHSVRIDSEATLAGRTALCLAPQLSPSRNPVGIPYRELLWHGSLGMHRAPA